MGTSNASAQGQVAHSAAQVYEEFFVPALFAQWADRVVAAAQLQPGDRVLDAACGTGVLARAARERVTTSGTVVGLDTNQGMLAVAKQVMPQIEWKHGRAEALPFDDASFDAVVSQFGLMFFEDRQRALREMWRVLRPGGRMAVAVWDRLENSPGYSKITALLQRLFGDKAADALRAPFGLGDKAVLAQLFAAAGIPDIAIRTQDGLARYPSLDAMIYTEIKGWTLADMLDDAQYARLRTEAARELAPFVAGDGSVAFSAPAHIVTATRMR
jgi:ubiquinone/menaquinone biosynthesis C-methylase UbiE